MNDVDASGASPTFPHLKGLRNGDIATSRIKQVASGRFGVTPEFLVNAEQLEIKIAQVCGGVWGVWLGVGWVGGVCVFVCVRACVCVCVCVCVCGGAGGACGCLCVGGRCA